MKQRLILLLLVITSLSTNQVCAYDFEVNGIYYTITSFEDFIVTVDGFSSTTSGIIEIPSSVTYNTRTFTVNSISSAQGGAIITTIIPTTVKTIAADAYSNTSIQYIIIPNNISKIEARTFQNCTYLRSVVISPNVSDIGSSAFDNCSILEKFNWEPNKPSSIGSNAFRYCKSLTSFTIPANVKSIGGYYQDRKQGAFYGCSNLDSLIIEDSDTKIMFFYYEALYNPIINNVGEFYGHLFKYLYYGRACDYVDGKYRKAPSINASYVVIGNKVTSSQNLPMGKDSVVIGESLNVIPDCSSLSSVWKYIKIKQLNPPKANGFSNAAYVNTTIYVPKGGKPLYESANIWKNFFNIKEFDDDGNEVETKKCVKPTISYLNGKLTFNCETEGVAFNSSITNSDITSYESKEVQLGVTYHISVYAAKQGYENSEVATATLCWIDHLPEMEGVADDEDKVSEVKATPILIQSEDGTINVKGAEDGTNVSVYEVNGKLVGSADSYNGQANIRTNLQSGSTAIVKIADRSIKVLIK